MARMAYRALAGKWAFSVSWAALLVAGPAAAEDAVPLDALRVEERGTENGTGPVGGYVARQSRTGTKTDSPIAKTPQSVSVVSREQMQDQKVESVAEALRYTPGVFAEYRGASNLRDEIFVRGFYYAPKYLDGLFLGGDLSYAKIEPYLLERVELLGGPSSVLYGQANPGGLVNMVSKTPTDTPLYETEVSVGTGHHYGAAFDLSDRLTADGRWAGRLAVTGLNRDLQEDGAERRAFAVAPSLRWTDHEATSLTLLGGYQNEPDAGYRNFLDAAGTITPIPGYGYVPRDFFVSDTGFEKFEREQIWIGYQLEHAVSDALTLRQNARYHQVEVTHHSLIYGSASASPTTGADTIFSRSLTGGTDDWRQITVDNQAEYRVATGLAAHTLLAGLDYRHRTRDYTWGRNRNVPSIDVANPVYGGFDFSSLDLTTTDDQDLTAEQFGLYLQDQIDIGGFSLLAGLRYDRASTDIDDNFNDLSYAYDDNALTWRVGALYTFANGIAPYVSYSTSFEPSLYAPEAGAPAFDPTTARQVEFGVKYAPEGTGLLLTAAVYDLRQKDVVMSAWDSNLGRSVYSQVGEVHNQGLELSAKAELDENLSMVASYSYIDSTIEDSVTAAEIGRTPARVPAHTASLWADYRFTEGAVQGLGLGAGARYIGTSQGNNTNSFEVPAVTLFDASASYDFSALGGSWQGVSVQVNAKNLTDETYVASCASAYACFYGEGRTVVATLKKRW